MKVAEPAFAQCAIVMSSDSRIGFSWSGEFLPRYSHMTHFLESASVWHSLLGWRFADIVRLSDPEPVLRVFPRCPLIQEASGEYVRWWLGDDYAIYVEPSIASPVASPLNIIVIAKTEEDAHAIRMLLSSEVDGSRPDRLLARLRPIGEAHPEPPQTWGVLVSASEVIGELPGE